MLYLNPNKEKVLTFEVELSGAAANEIKGYVRFNVEGVEIGFPAIITDGEIKSIISPLKDFLKNPVKNGTIFEAQLDLYTEDQEYFTPWKGEIEVKMPVTIEAKLADERSKPSDTKFAAKAKVIKEEKSMKTKRTPNKESGGKNGLTEKEKMWTKDKLKNITDEQIKEYMAKKGTKNPAIQEILLSEAIKAAGTGERYKVFAEVVKALKKPKR
jgi:hypothetical protein